MANTRRKNTTAYPRSATCVGRVSGKPLIAYASQSAADHQAVCQRLLYGRLMTPYRCELCDAWHLAPAERQTRGQLCDHCAGRDREPKTAYETCDDAERRARILWRENGVALSVYECPHGSGWHLTKC